MRSSRAPLVLVAAALFPAACTCTSRRDPPAQPTVTAASADRAPVPVPSASAPPRSPAASASAAPPAPPPSGPVFEAEGAVWSPDRKTIATLLDFQVHLWDGDTKAHLRFFDNDQGCTQVAFSPDGKKLYVGHENNPPAVLEDLADPTKLRYFTLGQGVHPETDRGVGMLSVSPDGAWLLARCDTVQVCLWNTKTGTNRKWTQTVVDSEDPSLESLAFEPGGKRIVAKTVAGKTYRLESPSLRRVP